MADITIKLSQLKTSSRFQEDFRVPSADNFQLTVDLNSADFDLEPEDLEALTNGLVEEIRELVEDAQLVRESDVPKDSKPALGGFVLGMLKAEVSFKNAKALLDFLGNRFSSKTLTLEFEANGRKHKLEYGNKEQLEDALQAIERLSKLT